MPGRVKMVAGARQNYGGRWLYRGDVFEVEDDSEADDMEAMRLAFRADDPDEAQEYEHESMQTDSVAKPAEKIGQRHRYRNRNLKATL